VIGRAWFPALIVCAALALCGCTKQASTQQQKAWNADLARLQAEQDSLRQRAEVLVQADPRLQRLPQGDVVISIPTSFLRTVILQVFDQVAESVTLRLGGIKAHVAKSVKKIVTIGDFVVDVDIKEIVGKLEPGDPRVGFDDNRVALSLPVAVNKGSGKAVIHFLWDGKNVAGMTCGDMDITETVTADVVPSTYVVSGTLALALEDNHVIATPRFPETKIRIKVAPTKQSWATIDRILAEKQGVCGWVLDKVDVPSILKRVVEEKGFNVTLPLSKVKAFRIPAGVSDSLTVKDRTIAVEARTNMIRIERDAILYSADVSLK
jgi:hypothetical protein